MLGNTPANSNYPRAAPALRGPRADLDCLPGSAPSRLESPTSPLEEGPLGLAEQANATGVIHFSLLPPSLSPSLPLSHHLPRPGFAAIPSFPMGLAEPQCGGNNKRLLFVSLPLSTLSPEGLSPPPGTKKSMLSPSPESCLLLRRHFPSLSSPGNPPSTSSQPEPWPGLGPLPALSLLNPWPQGCS